MNHFYLLLWLTAGLVSVLAGCNREPELLYGAESEVLSTLVKQTDLETIDLDAVPVKEVILSADDIIDLDSASNEELLIPYPAETEAREGKLFITDLMRSRVFIADSTNRVVRAVGRKGRGPGEFQEISGVTSHGRSLFIADHSLLRVNIYDMESLTFRKSFDMYVTRDDIAASGRYICTSAPYSDNTLVRVYRNGEPYDALASMLPKLIPPGKQPSAYNNFEIDANDDRLVAAYPGLPYLFIFDPQFIPRKTIQFTSGAFDEFNNPAPVPLGEAKSDPFENRVRRYIYDFELSESGSLYLVIDNVLTVLETTGGNLRIDGRYRLFDGTSGKKRLITMIFISEDNGTVYVNARSHPAVYRFELPG